MSTKEVVWFHGRNTTSRDAFWIGAYDYDTRAFSYQYGKGGYAPSAGRFDSKQSSYQTFSQKANDKEGSGYVRLGGGRVTVPEHITGRALLQHLVNTHSSSTVPNTGSSNPSPPVPTPEPVPDDGPKLSKAEARMVAIKRSSNTMKTATHDVQSAASAALNMVGILPFANEEELLGAYRSISTLRKELEEGLEELDSYLETFCEAVRNRIEAT